MVGLGPKLKDDRPVGLRVRISISGCMVVFLGCMVFFGVLKEREVEGTGTVVVCLGGWVEFRGVGVVVVVGFLVWVVVVGFLVWVVVVGLLTLGGLVGGLSTAGLLVGGVGFLV